MQQESTVLICGVEFTKAEQEALKTIYEMPAGEAKNILRRGFQLATGKNPGINVSHHGQS